jgi:hypothetical protein
MGRILLATVTGLAGFVAYLAGAATLAEFIGPLHWSLQALYYGVAGVLWAIPARSLMLWAARR